MSLLDIGQIEGRAQLIRTKLGLLDAPPPYSSTQITERFFAEVPIVGDMLPDGVTEMVVRDSKGRAQLYYSKRVGHPSQRLGILHGCYHLLTDLASADGIRKCDLTDRKFRQRAMPQDPVETACDLFAGALLAPFRMLDQFAPVTLFPRDPTERAAFDAECDQLASRFSVPVGFIRWRLYDLAKLRQTHFWMDV